MKSETCGPIFVTPVAANWCQLGSPIALIMTEGISLREVTRFLTLSIKNQSDGLGSGIITSIELSLSRRQHLATGEVVILTVTKMGLSETLPWNARAGQARRVASMLSPRDAALVEAHARECEDRARIAAIEGTKVNTRQSVEIRLRDSQRLGSPARPTSTK